MLTVWPVNAGKELIASARLTQGQNITAVTHMAINIDIREQVWLNIGPSRYRRSRETVLWPQTKGRILIGDQGIGVSGNADSPSEHSLDVRKYWPRVSTSDQNRDPSRQKEEWHKYKQNRQRKVMRRGEQPLDCR